MTDGLVIAAPMSGSGKTLITLGILRALRDKGVAVRAAKSGPDYIDPRFHMAACGSCVNLDAWAMSEARLLSLASGPGTLIVEGAMGLFDGAPPDGRGSTAHLVKALGAPVVLIVDAAHMAGSIAPLVAGFARHDPGVTVAAVILNKVGSPRHEAMLRRALEPLGLPVLGAVPRSQNLAVPSRHLGLVQAQERDDLEALIHRAAALASAHIDLDAFLTLTRPIATGDAPQVPPPGQRIAVAEDEAFAFSYPHLLDDWRAQGAEISFFSPLADEGPEGADLVFLPGGYPELHAGRIAANANFRQKMKNAAQTALIYGECGGYMVLGEGLIDAEGRGHEMLGLLPVATSFQTRNLHLGYRTLTASDGPLRGRWTGHEFHYATTLREEGTPLFTATDAERQTLPPMGLIKGKVMGSFAHLIDLAPDA